MFGAVIIVLVLSSFDSTTVRTYGLRNNVRPPNETVFDHAAVVDRVTCAAATTTASAAAAVSSRVTVETDPGGATKPTTSPRKSPPAAKVQPVTRSEDQATDGTTPCRPFTPRTVRRISTERTTLSHGETSLWKRTPVVDENRSPHETTRRRRTGHAVPKSWSLADVKDPATRWFLRMTSDPHASRPTHCTKGHVPSTSGIGTTRSQGARTRG